MSPVKLISLSALSAWALLSGGFAGLAAAQSDPHDRDSHSRIAFIQSNANTPGGDVYSMKPDGTDIRQLTNLGPANAANLENWSSDGRQLVFNEFPNNSNPQLWIMNADGSNQHLLLAEDSFGEWYPSFSPDGAWVAFNRCEDLSNGDGCAIYRVRADGSDLTAVTNFQLEVGDWEPEFSPDGATIAFESFNRDGFIAALYLTDLDGSHIRRITPPDLVAVNSHWSADGEKIVFRSHSQNPQNNDIWLINRDGSGLYRLTGTPATDLQQPVTYINEGPSWSPHGRAVVFDQFLISDSSETIYIVNADGSQMTQLMRRPAALRAAARARLKTRSHVPREVELGGFWARWSPELH